MKPILFCSTLALAALTWSSCEGKSKPEPDFPAQTREMVNFFEGYLGGTTTTPYNTDKAIDAAELDAERTLVWEAWKLANAGFDEEQLIATGPLSAQKSGAWHLPADLEPNAVMDYYWGTKGAKPTAGYPLFVYLHGSGTPANEWAGGIRMAQNFNDGPSVYFVPKIPNTGSYYRWYQRAKQYAYEKLLRQAFVRGDVDPNKVYFFGISEGGYGSQRLASFYADYLAGAGPMAGGEPLRNAPVENCRNTAFSLRTGADDVMFQRNNLTQIIGETFDQFEAMNPGSFVHWVELIPGRGHGIDYTPTTPWLRQYTRNPYPKVVTWENYEMDGRYRSGFHNLYVHERSTDDPELRSYYELRIGDDNQVSLRADVVSYGVTERDPRWGIEMRYNKQYTPATKGRVTIYLCPELVDLSRPVTVAVNGKEVFKGKPTLERRHIVNSCAAFFDPARLYPAAVEVDLGAL